MNMTGEAARHLDQVIDALHLEQATGRSRQELHRIVASAAAMMDLCVVLTDVVDSLLMDIDDALALVKTPLDEGDRAYFKELRKLVRASRKWARRATRDTHRSGRDEDMAAESDWWRNLILLVEDRTAEDELKTKQVIQWLTTMPSLKGLFDIHTRDFRRPGEKAYDT